MVQSKIDIVVKRIKSRQLDRLVEAKETADIEEVLYDELLKKAKPIYAEKESSYGHAQSVAILAMEEIRKAVIYYFAAEGIFPTEHIKEVELLRHKAKHIAFVERALK